MLENPTPVKKRTGRQVASIVLTEHGVPSDQVESTGAVVSPVGFSTPNAVAIPLVAHPVNWRDYVAPDKMVVTLEVNDSPFLRDVTEKMVAGDVGKLSDYIQIPSYSKLSPDMFLNKSIPEVFSLLFLGEIKNLHAEMTAFLNNNVTDRKIVVYTSSHVCIRELLRMRDRLTIIRTVSQ